MTFLKAQPLHAPPCLDSFDGDCLREGRSELRPTLTLEPCTYAGTLVVGRITSAVGRSVGHIGRGSGLCPPPVNVTAIAPPVVPVNHDREGMASALHRRVAPTSMPCTPVVSWCLSCSFCSSLIECQLSTVPPVAGLLLLVCRRRLILPPTRQITSRQTQQSAQGWCRWVTGAVKGVLISGQSPAVAAKLRGVSRLLAPFLGL